jgi:hypothetical protein
VTGKKKPRPHKKYVLSTKELDAIRAKLVAGIPRYVIKKQLGICSETLIRLLKEHSELKSKRL